MGNWYKIEDDFIETVNNILDSKYDTENSFPDYDSQKHNSNNDKKGELKYNTMVSQSKQLILMDRKLLNIYKKDKIEFCDIFDNKNNIFYHVKIKHSGSSDLSHLFAQAVVSETLSCRQEYKNKFKEISGYDLNDNRTIYFIIIGKPDKLNGKVSIPIFSKIAMYYAIESVLE